MKIKNTTKLVSIILLVSVFLFFCFSIIHLTKENHDNDNCEICILINKIKKELDSFKPNSNIILSIIILFFIDIIFNIKTTLIDKRYNTLTGLKVELLN